MPMKEATVSQLANPSPRAQVHKTTTLSLPTATCRNSSTRKGSTPESHLLGRQNGERSEDQEDLLQKQGVQEAHTSQGHSVPEG
uniref:Uncharacterized protein n=1 Tax=Triticum urartu TaxID=4572 RepID=A0A8R7TH79_TRIUA